MTPRGARAQMDQEEPGVARSTPSELSSMRRRHSRQRARVGPMLPIGMPKAVLTSW